MFTISNTKRFRKNIKKFKKKKFNYPKYVRDFYIEDGKAHIYAKVDSYEDIISKFSVREYEVLNRKFSNYLEELTYYIPVEYSVELEISGHSFTKEEELIIEETIKDHFGLKLSDVEIDLKDNRRNSLILLLTSIVMLGLLYVLFKADIGQVLLEAYLVIVWFFLWTYSEFEFIDRYKLKIRKLDFAQLASMQIIFKH